MRIWYDTPADEWTEALPAGNGRIGAMVFGRIGSERIQLNEDTLWSGPPGQWNNPGAREALSEVRDHVKAGRYEAADQATKKMMGPFVQSYLPLGDLLFDLDHGEKAEEYARELELSTAISRVSYRVADVLYTREAFVSYPDQVAVFRFEADRPGALNLALRWGCALEHAVHIEGDDPCGDLMLTGRAPRHVDPDYYSREGRTPVVQQDERGPGMAFCGRARMIVDDGTCMREGQGLRVRGATAITVLVAAGTSYAGFRKALERDPVASTRADLDKAQRYSYDELRDRHVADHGRLFQRVGFHIEGGSQDAVDGGDRLPTDQRIIRYGASDLGLVELAFQYGRYLLIASSRPGTQPANLQGIWNERVRPPWSSNYTLNINTEMNYWPAETCNLAECHEPLINFIEDLAVNGEETARINYGCRGWVAHHNSDLWRQAAPVGDFGHGDPVWAMWPMAAPWLAQHLWEVYAFGGDRDFLADRAYPVMKAAALFCLDWLILFSDETLGTVPSTSPEHKFVTSDGQKAAVSMSATMDIALIWDLFTRCIDAADILDVDHDFRSQLAHARAKLPPQPISTDGYLQEWAVDWDDDEPEHRHVSHLFGLHPGTQITEERMPEHFAAVRQSMERRGQGGTGWSLAWKINLWARLMDGEKAHELIEHYLMPVWTDEGRHAAGGVYPNLFGAHPPFQIDGNFGVTAGMAEMIVQSHEGYVHLLPALPTAWPDGRITGLRARGGYTIGVAWADGLLQRSQIQGSVDGRCAVRIGARARPRGDFGVFHQNSLVARFSSDAPIEFVAEKDRLYTLQRI